MITIVSQYPVYTDLPQELFVSACLSLPFQFTLILCELGLPSHRPIVGHSLPRLEIQKTPLYFYLPINATAVHQTNHTFLERLSFSW